MPIAKFACLVAGSLLVFTAACRPAPPESPATSSIEMVQEVGTTQERFPVPPPTASLPDITLSPLPSTPENEATAAELVTPTPFPDFRVPSGWKGVGFLSEGAWMIAPDNWVNLSPLLNSPDVITRLGPTVRLVVTDSKETSNRLFTAQTPAAAAIGQGAFVLALLDPSLSGSPTAGLEQILTPQANFESSMRPLAVNGLTGAVADVSGNPLGFLPVRGDGLRLRVAAVLPTDEGEGQWVIILGAAAERWGFYEPVFRQMLNSLHLFGGQELAGIVTPHNVVGTLTSGTQVAGSLSNDKPDTWLFYGQSGSYATITLTPNTQSNNDLIFTLIDPAGRVMAVLDTGFTNDAERLVDVLLYRTGTYQIQVTEFFRQPGTYTLHLSITHEPQFEGGGRIAPGQEVTSQLPARQVQTWVFEGSAGEIVSLILTPLDEQFDAVLQVVGPDGRELVNLDEGFSGDAEVIANLELPATGEYVIVVREFNRREGRYKLALNRGGTALSNFYDAGDLVYGQVKGESLQADEAHAWFFVGEAGDEITLVVTPLTTRADMTVWLLGPTLQRLVMQDEFFAGATETIVYRLPLAGQYTILVQEFYGEAAAYQIVLTGGNNPSLELAGNIAYGETVTGNISQGKEMVWVFAAQQGDVISVTLRPRDNNSDLVLVLRDPDNNIIWVVDNALAGEPEYLLTFTVSKTGEWTLLLREFFAMPGSYALTLMRIEE